VTLTVITKGRRGNVRSWAHKNSQTSSSASDEGDFAVLPSRFSYINILTVVAWTNKTKTQSTFANVRALNLSARLNFGFASSSDKSSFRGFRDFVGVASSMSTSSSPSPADALSASLEVRFLRGRLSKHLVWVIRQTEEKG